MIPTVGIALVASLTGGVGLIAINSAIALVSLPPTAAVAVLGALAFALAGLVALRFVTRDQTAERPPVAPTVKPWPAFRHAA